MEDHFKTTHVCTNCFQSISPFIANDEDDKENIDRHLRKFFLNLKPKTLEHLAQKYPEQAKKVEVLRSEFAQEEERIATQVKDIYNIHSNIRPAQQSSTSTRSPLAARSTSNYPLRPGRAVSKSGLSSNIASCNYPKPPNPSQVNIAVAAPLSLPSGTSTGSSKDNRPSVATSGSTPNVNILSTTLPVNSIAPSPNLVEGLDTASSQKSLQSNDSGTPLPTTAGGNAVGNSFSSGARTFNYAPLF